MPEQRSVQPIPHLHAVVPAGGAGTRLWPLSRRAAPKFLLDLTGSGRSLLQTTVDRLAPLVQDRVVVVTGRAHRAAVVAQLDGLPAEAVLAEPSPRDSMAAVGLAAAVLERRHPDAVIGSFAADHVITDAAAFAACVADAVEVARAGWLVTLGIVPTHAATGFGYVEVGDRLHGVPGYRAAAFVEKPPPALAEEYVAAGRHRWNAGIFVVRPGVLLDLLADSDPRFAADLRWVASADGPEALERRVEEAWPRLPRIALDHAVAEPAARAGRVAVVAGEFGWDDVGDFDALAALLGAGAPGRATAVLGEEAAVHAVDASGLVVPGSGRTVAVVGLDDVVVVDTPDAVLVTSRDRAQQVRRVVDALREAGADDLT